MLIILQKSVNLAMALLKFIIYNIFAIHYGGTITKVKATLTLAITVSPIPFILERVTAWYFDNYVYVSFIFVAVFFDHLVGSFVHAFIKRDFSWKRNIKGFLTKTSMVVVVGVLLEGIVHILGSNFLTDYFSVLSKLMIFIYPAGSALANVAIITDGKFPPTAWMDRLKKFNKNLKINELTDNEGE